MAEGGARWAVALGIVAASALAGCQAKINAFTATPRYVCSGQKVQLAWSVTGSGAMHATPPVDGLRDGPVADDGQLTIAPVATTSVELHVTRFLGSATSSIQEIRVQQPSQAPEDLVVSLADPSARCTDAARSVSATVHAQHFSPNVTVAVVASRPGDPRSYRVSHAGITAMVTPGGGSITAWAGTPLTGDWLLESPLGADESCGPSLPRNLGVEVFTRCSPEGPA